MIDFDKYGGEYERYTSTPASDSDTTYTNLHCTDNDNNNNNDHNNDYNGNNTGDEGDSTTDGSKPSAPVHVRHSRFVSFRYVSLTTVLLDSLAS
jgi:hypothetical protein